MPAKAYAQAVESELPAPPPHADAWSVFDRATLAFLGTCHGQTALAAFSKSGINRHFSEVWVRLERECDAAWVVIDLLLAYSPRDAVKTFFLGTKFVMDLKKSLHQLDVNFFAPLPAQIRIRDVTRTVKVTPEPSLVLKVNGHGKRGRRG